MFRRLSIGPLVGTRTWGGLIGIGGYPSADRRRLRDARRAGRSTARTAQFDVENKGVAPDVEVELDPHAWRQGHDAQLEKGVAMALDLLKQHPTPALKRPPYPVYEWKKLRDGLAQAGRTTAGSPACRLRETGSLEAGSPREVCGVYCADEGGRRLCLPAASHRPGTRTSPRDPSIRPRAALAERHCPRRAEDERLALELVELFVADLEAHGAFAAFAVPETADRLVLGVQIRPRRASSRPR